MSASSPASPFDPPRAGRGATWWRLWAAYRRGAPTLGRAAAKATRLATDRLLHAPAAVIPVLIVPLLGLYWTHSARARLLGTTLCLAAMLVAVVYFDRFIAGFALGLVAAINGHGIDRYMELHDPAPTRLRRALSRLWITLACAAILIHFVPRLVEKFAMPVGTAEGGAVFINPRDLSPPIAGERVAFLAARVTEGNRAAAAGRYLGTVLAGPGDRVEFAHDRVLVNGRPGEILPYMPLSGGLVVPAGHALFWPEGFRVGESLGPDRIGLPARAYVLPHSALVGRPYKRWFWRTQSP